MVNFTSVLKSLQVRNAFNLPDKNLLQWFPGHMGKGLKQMKQKLKSVDCVIEVHDARIPMSGRNIHFKSTVSGLRPHVLVLNKKDLSDLKDRRIIEEDLEKQGISRVIYTNCKDQSCKGVREVVPTVKELIMNANRYNRNEVTEFCVMIIGVPNVGKSSLINVLRNIYLKKSNAAPVGAVAGITKSVMSRIKVSQDPLIYVLDTPGILHPSVTNIQAGLKLALCSSMQDHLVGPNLIADYLLYWLNTHENYGYVKYLGLKEPCDNITEVLLLTAVNLKRTVKIRSLENDYIIKPDLEYAANYFIKAFRMGEFGKIMLDDL